MCFHQKLAKTRRARASIHRAQPGTHAGLTTHDHLLMSKVLIYVKDGAFFPLESCLYVAAQPFSHADREQAASSLLISLAPGHP